MPAELLPPDAFYRLSVTVMHAPTLPATVRDTYANLRVFAWAGFETPDLSWEQIVTSTGKDRKTLYRHLLTLANTGVTRWRTAGVGLIRLTFTDGIGGAENRLNFETSQKREHALSSVSTHKELKPKTKDRRRLKNETGQKRDKAAGNLYPLAAALAEVCHMVFEANQGRLFTEAKLLSKINPTPTPDLLRQHYNGNPNSFWRTQDWRGKKGERPNPATIRETWGRWNEPVENQSNEAASQLRAQGYTDADGNPI